MHRNLLLPCEFLPVENGDPYAERKKGKTIHKSKRNQNKGTVQRMEMSGEESLDGHQTTEDKRNNICRTSAG